MDGHGNVLGSNPRVARQIHLDHLTRTVVEGEVARADGLSVLHVMARRIGVRAHVKGRVHRPEGQVVPRVQMQTHVVTIRHVTRPHPDALRDDRRNVDDLRHESDPQAAITLNSTAIGVGSARTSTVVRVASTSAKNSP